MTSSLSHSFPSPNILSSHSTTPIFIPSCIVDIPQGKSQGYLINCSFYLCLFSFSSVWWISFSLSLSLSLHVSLSLNVHVSVFPGHVLGFPWDREVLLKLPRWQGRAGDPNSSGAERCILGLQMNSRSLFKVSLLNSTHTENTSSTYSSYSSMLLVSRVSVTLSLRCRCQQPGQNLDQQEQRPEAADLGSLPVHHWEGICSDTFQHTSPEASLRLRFGGFPQYHTHICSSVLLSLSVSHVKSNRSPTRSLDTMIVSLSDCASVPVSLCLSLYACLSLPVSLFLSLSSCLSLPVSLFLSLSACVSLSVSLTVCGVFGPGPGCWGEEGCVWRPGHSAAGPHDDPAALPGSPLTHGNGGVSVCFVCGCFIYVFLTCVHLCVCVVYLCVWGCVCVCTQGLGTDEETLLEILCTRSSQQLTDISAAYNTSRPWKPYQNTQSLIMYLIADIKRW